MDIVCVGIYLMSCLSLSLLLLRAATQIDDRLSEQLSMSEEELNFRNAFLLLPAQQRAELLQDTMQSRGCARSEAMRLLIIHRADA